MVEEFQLNLFGVVFLFGALQGLILTLIFLFNDTFHRKSNFFLCALLISFTTLNLTGALEETDIYNHYPVIRFLPIIWYSIIPPATYFFIQYLIQSDYKFKPWGYLLFIPFLLDFSFQCFELISYLLGEIKIPDDLSGHYFYQNIFEFIAVFFSLAVIILILRTLSNYEDSLYNNYAEISDKSLKWLSRTLMGGLVLILIWLGTTFLDFSSRKYATYFGRLLPLGLSILIYWIGYSILMRRELFINQKNINSESSPNEGTKLSEKAEDHYLNLISIIKEKKLYQNPDINMSMLSEEIGLSKSYVSQIINTKEGKNFFDFINTYRVEEVKQKMADPAFEHYSILGLAMEAGFKSKSTFNAVFKKMTGMTPSKFRNNQP